MLLGPLHREPPWVGPGRSSSVSGDGLGRDSAGLRAKVGARHVTISELVTSFLGAGLARAGGRAGKPHRPRRSYRDRGDPQRLSSGRPAAGAKRRFSADPPAILGGPVGPGWTPPKWT